MGCSYAAVYTADVFGVHWEGSHGQDRLSLNRAVNGAGTCWQRSNRPSTRSPDGPARHRCLGLTLLDNTCVERDWHGEPIRYCRVCVSWDAHKAQCQHNEAWNSALTASTEDEGWTPQDPGEQPDPTATGLNTLAVCRK